jgi:hypothetical protein
MCCDQDSEISRDCIPDSMSFKFDEVCRLAWPKVLYWDCNHVATLVAA